MADDTFSYIQDLTNLLNGIPSARWNFPLAVGSSLDSPAGLGQPAALTYSFVQTPPSYYDSTDPVHSQFRSFTAAEIAATRNVLAHYSEVINITFTASASTLGQMTFGAAGLPQNEAGFAYGPAYSSSFTGSAKTIVRVSENATSGDVWLQRSFVDAVMQPGAHGYSTLLHEVGHALGLKHPFDPTHTLPSSMDSTRYTVMSYTAPENMGIVTVSGDASGYSWTTGATVEARSLMPLDILALQYLYGANTSSRAGNDTYSWQPSERFLQTLWDGGGSDTIDCSNQALPCAIDLNGGAYSSIGIRSTAAELRLEMPSFATQADTPTYDGRNNLAIAYNVTIENAIGGRGNDVLTGNSANNRLTGAAGNDALDGGTGTDIAAFSGSRSSYSVTRNNDGTMTVSDQRSGSADGTDALANIERLAFSDKNLAFDASGSAGNTAKLIGAAFGIASLQPTLNGIGIQVFDSGLSLQQVAEAALNTALFAQIAGSRSNEAVVRTVYTNVVGSAPSAADTQFFVGWLQDGMSQADLLVLAANTDLNAQHINLAGISSTGLEYV